MKVFLDTNIVISYLDSQRADHEDAVKLIADFYKMDILMILSQDIMTNVIYNCTNKKQAVEFFQRLRHRNIIVLSGDALGRCSTHHGEEHERC